MRVAGGGPQAPMPQQFLTDAQRDPPFPEMSRLGVSQGRDGGLLGDAALAHHRFERLLEGGGGHRHRPVLSGEQPEARPRVLPVRASQLQGPVSQWSRAVLPPVALTDPDQHALGGDIRDLELCPVPEAEPTRVDHPQTHPRVRALDQG